MIKHNKTFLRRLFDRLPLALWNYTFYSIIIGLVMFLVVQPTILNNYFNVSDQHIVLTDIDNILFAPQENNSSVISVNHDSFGGFLLKLSDNVLVCSWLLIFLLTFQFFADKNGWRYKI